MSNHNKPASIFSQKKPWDNNENNAWLATTINIYRNLEKFKFPGKLDTDRQRQIVSVIGKELSACPLLSNPAVLDSEKMTPLQKEFLVEHFLSSQSFQHVHNGEAFAFDDTGEFLATINMTDHIHFQLIDCRGELESAWNRLVDIETSIGKSVSYSFSHKYGFLTADPTTCGNALSISVFLQLPGLVHSEKIDETLERLAEDSISISGIQGNPTEIIGDVLVAQNNYTLGVTEENIISSLRSFTTKILVEENSIRSKIRHEESAEIKDRVSRAFGILIHSYQIEAVEALNALSLVKLGVELGWVKGISTQALNRLFFNCRRAHLLFQFPSDSIKAEELPHKRAEYIRSSFKDVHLTI